MDAKEDKASAFNEALRSLQPGDRLSVSTDMICMKFETLDGGWRGLIGSDGQLELESRSPPCAVSDGRGGIGRIQFHGLRWWFREDEDVRFEVRRRSE